MRAALDWLYGAARVAACLAMVSILLLVVTQMLSRMVGLMVLGVDEYAGYAMLATVFLALAPALKAGAHIRVTLLIQALPPRAAWICEVFSLVVGLGLSGYFAYWACNFVLESGEIRAVAQGLVATPLWIPQSGMAIGLLVFVVALTDELAITLTTSPAGVRAKQAVSQLVKAGEV